MALAGASILYILVYMFLLEIAAALGRERVSYAIAGGYAVSLHGAVRGTVDVDLVISLKESSYIACENALKSIGLHEHRDLPSRPVALILRKNP